MTQPNTETDVIDPILHLDCGLLREGISPDANAVMFLGRGRSRPRAVFRRYPKIFRRFSRNFAVFGKGQKSPSR